MVKQDLAVKVGEYEKDGEPRSRYLNIGELITHSDGRSFISINAAYLSPALLMFIREHQKKGSRDKAFITVFDPKEEGQPRRAVSSGSQSTSSAQGKPPADDFDDDIPF